MDLIRLMELGASDYGLDKLVVNNLDFICLLNCTADEKGVSELGIFFNDRYNCTLYFTRLRVEYDLTDLNSTLISILFINSLDIRHESNNHSIHLVSKITDKKFAFSFINTHV